MRIVENGILLRNRGAKSIRACVRFFATALCAAAMAFSLGGCSSSTTSADVNGTPSNATASSCVISAAEGHDLMASTQDYLLIDVREQYEYAEGHIERAICIPYTQLESSRDKLPADTCSTIIVYCRSGNRSAMAAKTLSSMGYTNVLDMGGVIDRPYGTIAGEAAQEQSVDAKATASPNVSADHVHRFEPYDCNYQKCTVCGYTERY